jgi:hypothetical protein
MTRTMMSTQLAVAAAAVHGGGGHAAGGVSSARGERPHKGGHGKYRQNKQPEEGEPHGKFTCEIYVKA